MKKVLGVAALAALFATSAMAASLDIRVVTTSDASAADPAASVPVMVQVQLDGGGAPTSDGLALIGFNIDVTPSGGAADADLCDTSGFLLMAPLSMQSFDRKDLSGPGFSNDGLTNPKASPNLSGYSGTCDGSGALLQLGGGQNTIGNTPGGAPYPIGSVVTGVGNGGWMTVATGDIDASSLSSGMAWDVTVNTVFANTIDMGQSSAPYAVSEVTTVNITGGLHIEQQGTLCADADVNCDGSVTALDLGVVVAPANWQKPAFPGGALCDRADVNNDGNVTALDLGAIVAPVVWQTSSGPCTCVTLSPGSGGCPTP
ncbi:MAG TPA: dockerin type I domain-containing protein [Phycisphaerae bacterium]|nr:hypothetical protein [Phycisphaerales bacterium]HRX85413.1 dockerin type I domain-containing protein [Phycisphaerae bacterium]